MEISKSFVVKASPDAVWRLLTDPIRVALCLPGAAITNQVDDSTHAGTMTVKVGPVTATYKGTMRFERLDPATRTAEIVAAGQDVRGKGGADLRMTSTLVERGPGETDVQITSQVNVMGILAQFGRGMIQDLRVRISGTFVAAVGAELEKPGEPDNPSGAAAPTPEAAAPRPGGGSQGESGGAPPIDVLSLGSAVVGRATVRAAARPWFWVGLIVVLLVLWWMWMG